MKHDGSDCTCGLCAGKSRSKGPRSQSLQSTKKSTGTTPRPTTSAVPASDTAPKPARRQSRRQRVYDEEKTLDIFKTLVAKLRKADIDKAIKEKKSADWHAANEHLETYLMRVAMQHSFVPRIGELVLWAPDIHGQIRYNPKTTTFQVYSQKSKSFISDVPWRAGVVSQVPEDTVYLRQAFFDNTENASLNTSGFRVETLPDTNGTDKNYTHQYRYVSLSHIRPLNFWQIFLMNIDPEKFHPSIDYAMTVMASVSVLGKHRFKGSWPNASISCKGIYLGTELLLTGDTICLVPQKALEPDCIDPPPVTDIMVLSDVEVYLENCNDDPESNLLCEKTSVRLVGKTYTTDSERAWRPRRGDKAQFPEPLTDEEATNAFESVGMRENGPWYRLESRHAVTRISPNLALGRFYELDYMKYMFGGKSMSYSLSGILAGREYGRKTDQRIPEGKEWFFGDTRIETLAVATVNGIEVGKYDSARDLSMLQASLKIVDGDASQQNLKAARVLTRDTFGMIGSSRNEDTFETVGKTSTMVAAALEPTPAANSEPDELAMDVTIPQRANDVSHATKTNEVEMIEVADSSSGEDEDAKLAAELDSFLNDPARFVRGGTEESEEGDYTPHSKASSSNKRRRL